MKSQLSLLTLYSVLIIFTFQSEQSREGRLIISKKSFKRNPRGLDDSSTLGTILTYFLKSIPAIVGPSYLGYKAADHFWNPDHQKTAYNKPSFIKFKEQSIRNYKEMYQNLEVDQKKLENLIKKISDRTFQASQKYYEFDRAMRDTVLNMNFELVKKKWRK